MLLITEILDRLYGSKLFIKLDLKDIYYRIRIKRGDKWKTIFRIYYNYFKYLIMPFGLANIPATFQAYINRALASLINITYIVYLNNILIFNAKPAEY